MFSEDDLLPISALQHLVFCERQCALIHIEGLWEENVLTAQGRVLHEKVHNDDEGEVRAGVRIARGLRLRSLRLGLSGVADVVEFDLGGAGPPVPFPVEYKRGRPKPDDCDLAQLCAQALCLEEMLGVAVLAGAIFYGKPRRRLEVAIDEALRARTEALAGQLHALISSGRTPLVPYQKKCDSCSLLSLCLPRVTGGRQSARHYLQHSLADSLADRPANAACGSTGPEAWTKESSGGRAETHQGESPLDQGDES